jgi:hypothetical protein
VDGVCVPGYVVERPAEISVQKIDGEKDAGVRRVMIERYRHGEGISGRAAFIRDTGGERLHHDEPYGTLWRRNVPGEEPVVMVEIVDHGKRYWRRVPPNMTTAQEAVAWIRVSTKDYAPAVET